MKMKQDCNQHKIVRVVNSSYLCHSYMRSAQDRGSEELSLTHVDVIDTHRYQPDKYTTKPEKSTKVE